MHQCIKWCMLKKSMNILCICVKSTLTSVFTSIRRFLDNFSLRKIIVRLLFLYKLHNNILLFCWILTIKFPLQLFHRNVLTVSPDSGEVIKFSIHWFNIHWIYVVFHNCIFYFTKIFNLKYILEVILSLRNPIPNNLSSSSYVLIFF